MRTKNINDIIRQADRIRAGYGWKARKNRWDYIRYMAISNKVDKISMRYTRNIGKHQRGSEGMTKEYQAREWDTISNIPYNANIYMK